MLHSGHPLSWWEKATNGRPSASTARMMMGCPLFGKRENMAIFFSRVLDPAGVLWCSILTTPCSNSLKKSRILTTKRHVSILVLTYFRFKMYVFSDIDECLLYPCGDYATCENINNGYICTCDYGYAKNDNQICEGITQF